MTTQKPELRGIRSLATCHTMNDGVLSHDATVCLDAILRRSLLSHLVVAIEISLGLGQIEDLCNFAFSGLRA